MLQQKYTFYILYIALKCIIMCEYIIRIATQFHCILCNVQNIYLSMYLSTKASVRILFCLPTVSSLSFLEDLMVNLAEA